MSLYQNILRQIGHISWVSISIRERVIRFLTSDDNDAFFSVPFGGYSYSGTLDNLIDWRVFYLGGHELAEMNYLKKISQQSRGVMLDVGMNVGQHALYMCDDFDRVLGFEPYPPLARIAEDRFKKNKIDNIEVFVFGLGDKEAELVYIPPNSNNYGVGFFNVENNEFSRGCILKVKMGDEVIKNILNDDENITLIKIDVEGMEREVIIGLKETLAKYRPIMFFEYSDKTRSHYSNFDDFLCDFPDHYTFYKLICNQRKWIVLNSGQCSLERFDDLAKTGNLLAVPEELWGKK